MAELTVKGEATRKVVCNNTEYHFEFNKEGDSVAEVTKYVEEELEKFLTLVEQMGIDASEFSMGNLNARKNGYHKEDEPPYEATRHIYLYSEFNPSLSNAFAQLVVQEKLDVEYAATHYASNLNEIHKELLREAMENSRNKAEIIAACAGKKVIGIAKVDVNYAEYDDELEEMRSKGCHFIGDSDRLSNKLRAEADEESEEVEVIWLIES